jgi:benzoyl-CoA reductase/2-hydroxyglutaryl-CoA dehydratase subunit BcrC/BadD/HgdB
MKTDRFDPLLEELPNALVQKAVEDGGIPVGYTCSYVPPVLLSIPPLFPVRMRAPGASGTELADIYLSKLTCSYTRSLLEFAMDFRYDFLGGWVHAASCDHLRRLHDNLTYLMAPPFSHIIDVPHRTGKEGLDWYLEELKILVQRLESHFGLTITDDDLIRAVADYNDLVGLLAAVAERRKDDRPPLSGAEFHKMMLAAFISPWPLIRKPIEDFRDGLREKKDLKAPRARLMLVGGQMDDPRYIETIESTGALVVADRVCTGSIPGLEPIRPAATPLLSIAEHTLGAPSCPRMMEDFDRRLKQIVDTAAAYRVDGIILEFIKFCDTWGVESASLVAALRESGFRVLSLEREYSGTAHGQLLTRVQAFLESMGK